MYTYIYIYIHICIYGANHPNLRNQRMSYPAADWILGTSAQFELISMAMQQESELELLTHIIVYIHIMYKVYVSGLFFRGYPQNIWPYCRLVLTYQSIFGSWVIRMDSVENHHIIIIIHILFKSQDFRGTNHWNNDFRILEISH